MANITSPFAGGGSDTGGSGTSDTDDSQDTLRDIRDEQRRQQQDTTDDPAPVDTRQAEEELRDVRDEQRRQQEQTDSTTDDQTGGVSPRRTQNLKQVTEQAESATTTRLSDAPIGARRAIRQTEQAGFDSKPDPTFDRVSSDRFQRNVAGATREAESMSVGRKVSDSPLNTNVRRGPRGQTVSTSGQASGSLYSDVIEPTGLFVGDILLEGPDSPQVTDVDERLRQGGDFAFDVTMGGSLADEYSPIGDDDVEITGAELNLAGVQQAATEGAVASSPYGVGIRLLDMAGVDESVGAVESVLQGRPGEAQKTLRNLTDDYRDTLNRAASDPTGTATETARDFVVQEEDAPELLTEGGQGELNEDVVRSLTKGDGLFEEGTRELEAPSNTLEQPTITPGIGSDEDIKQSVADANPGVDPEDVIVTRGDGSLRYRVDLDEQDVRERVAAANPGVDPEDVIVTRGGDGDIEFVTPEGGEGLFDTTEYELRQRIADRQETFGVGDELSGAVESVVGEGHASDFAQGFGSFPGEVAALPSVALLGADKTVEIAPNVPGTVEEYGAQETLVTGLEYGGRTTDRLATYAEENPAEFAGEITAEVAAGLGAGFAGKRAIVSLKGRRNVKGINPQGKVDIRDVERPEIRQGDETLTTFSERSVPGGRRSMPEEDFPVEPQDTPEKELELLAETYSDTGIERALGVEEGEVTLFSARTGLKEDAFEPRSGRPYDPDAGFFAGSVARNFLPLGDRRLGVRESIRRFRPRLPRPVKAYKSVRDAGDPENVPAIVATTGRLRTFPDDVRTRGEITRYLQQQRRSGEFYVRQADNQSGEAEALISAVGSEKTNPDPGAGIVDYGEASRFVEAGDPFVTEIGGVRLPIVGQVGGEKVPIQLFRPETDTGKPDVGTGGLVDDVFDADGTPAGGVSTRNRDFDFDRKNQPDIDVGEARPFETIDSRDAPSRSRQLRDVEPGTPVIPTFVPSSSSTTGGRSDASGTYLGGFDSPTGVYGSPDDTGGGYSPTPTNTPTTISSTPTSQPTTPTSTTTTSTTTSLTPTTTTSTTTPMIPGTPGEPITGTPRLPDFDLEADEKDEVFDPFGTREGEFTDFVNPLTGEVIETERTL